MTKRQPEKLTKRLVQGLAYDGGWDVRWDTEVKGFGVRLHKHGTKTFILSCRVQGRKRQIALGHFDPPRFNVEDARDRARAMLVLAKEGTDPEGKPSLLPAPGEPGALQLATFARVVDRFIEDYAKPRQRTWKETERTLRVNCAPWLDWPFAKIGRADVYALLDEFKAEGKEAKARVTLAWLSSLYKWADKRELGDLRVVNVDLEIERKIRDRHYGDDEIEAVWNAANNLSKLEGAYIKLILLLGVRRGELAGMRRSEFDDPTKPTLWTIPHERTKTKKSRKREKVYIVPLPRLAQRIIKSIPKLEGDAIDGDIVFPGRHRGKPMAPGSALQHKVQKKSKVGDWTYHACRDTIASWLKTEGHSEYERGLILNHSEHTVTADYSHGYPVDLKRELLEKWASHVSDVMQPGAALMV